MQNFASSDILANARNALADGQAYAAAEVLADAIQHTPVWPDAYGVLGEAFAALGDADSANDCFATALDQWQTAENWHAAWEQGRSWSRAGLLAPSVADRARELAVRYGETRLRTFRDEAIAIAEDLLAEAPEDLPALELKGQAIGALADLEVQIPLVTRITQVFDARRPIPPPEARLPEVAVDATPEDIANAIGICGIVKIPQMLPPDQVARLMSLPGPRWNDNNQITDALPPRVLEIAGAILGRPVRRHLTHQNVRRVVPDVPESQLAWHQDSVPMQAMAVNMWTALVDCDEQTPRIEFLMRRFHHAMAVKPIPGNTGLAYETTDEELAKVLDPAKQLAPLVKAGDSLAFLVSTLHRSYATPDMTKTRWSVELRFR